MEPHRPLSEQDAGLGNVPLPPLSAVLSPPWRKDQQLRHLEQADACVICLDATSEPCTLLPCEHLCYHYVCINEWLKIKPQCPLCKATVSSVVHGPVGQQQTREYYPSTVPAAAASGLRVQTSSPALAYAASPLRSFHFGLASASLQAPRPDEPAGLAFRREVYRHLRYSMHIGTNPVSRYREVTRDMFNRDIDLQARVRIFLRRELRVFSWLSTPEADDLIPLQGESIYTFRDRKRAITVERLLGHILRLLQHFEIRGSDGSLEDDLATHLGRENTRLLLHELHSFLRSPYSSLEDWDREVQYADAPELRNRTVDIEADASGNQSSAPEHEDRHGYAGVESYRGGYRRRRNPLCPDATSSGKRTGVSAYASYDRTAPAASHSTRLRGRSLRGPTHAGIFRSGCVRPDNFCPDTIPRGTGFRESCATIAGQGGLRARA